MEYSPTAHAESGAGELCEGNVKAMLELVNGLEQRRQFRLGGQRVKLRFVLLEILDRVVEVPGVAYVGMGDGYLNFGHLAKRFVVHSGVFAPDLQEFLQSGKLVDAQGCLDVGGPEVVADARNMAW